MKTLKKIFTIITASVLTVSLTACTVPYTYIKIAGKYIGEHKEAFPEMIDAIESKTAQTVNSLTDNPETATYFMSLLGIAEEESAQSEESASLSEIVPQTSESTTENKNEKIESKEQSEVPQPEAEKKPETSPSVTEDKSEEAQVESGDSFEDQSEKTKEKSEAEKNESTKENSAASESGNTDKEETTEPEKPVESFIQSKYVPEYVHYEKADFEALCNEFKQAGKDNNAEKIVELYDKLSEDLMLICTMNSVAFINFSVNVNEKYYDDEYNYTEKLITDCNDLYLLALREVLESDGKKALTEHGNASILEEAAEYEAMSDHEKELLERETKLTTKYNTELDKVDSLTIQYKGKSYSFGDLYDDSSPLSMLSVFNYNDYLKVYEGLLRKANETLGPIYLELLMIRAEIAKENDYDSYADYCYENDYGRAYTTKEAEEYCEIIKKNVGPKYYQNAYYSIYNSNYYSTEFTTEQMLDIMDGFTKGFDSLINDSLKELREKQLFDIGNGTGRYAGSYTTSLYSEHVPFVFINGDNTLSTLSTFSHEFGHFTNDLYEEKDPDYFFTNGNYDIFEIHSNALELLCSNHYKEIVGDTEADQAELYELALQLNSVIDGCIYDEFQRKAYEKPSMTLNQLNQLFGQINSEYGNSAIPGNEYMWVLINHNFESPMYYISYSISALSAMEIWTISQKSEKEAVDVWLKVMKEADDEDYETVMKNAGLTPFTDSKGVLSICDSVLDKF